MVNFCLNENEISILKNLVGKKLINIRHDPFDKFEGETVYGKIELFFNNLIILINYDYEKYSLFGSQDDDHPKFSIKAINEQDAVSALENTKQINVKINDTINDIVIVEDYIDVEWNGKKDNVKTLTAIIFKFEEYEIAIQGDYMIPLLEITKGEDCIDKLVLPGEEFFNDSTTKFKSQRSFIELSKY